MDEGIKKLEVYPNGAMVKRNNKRVYVLESDVQEDSFVIQVIELRENKEEKPSVTYKRTRGLVDTNAMHFKEQTLYDIYLALHHYFGNKQEKE